MSVKLSDNFFEALGEPNPGHPFNLLDAYRFRLCYKQVLDGSLLDVGVFLGDFLKLAQFDNRELLGTEVNEARVRVANSILGQKIVVQDFRNGNLTKFADNSVDNVVCMETIEHVVDHKHAIDELCRVARNRVIITVPYREKLHRVLCMHCDQFTPHFGHQHRYDKGSFDNLIPEDWQVQTELPFAKRITRMVSQIVPESKSMIPLLTLVDKIAPGDGKWILIVLERPGRI